MSTEMLLMYQTLRYINVMNTVAQIAPPQSSWYIIGEGMIKILERNINNETTKKKKKVKLSL
jgi:hypothetical protein